MVAAALLPLRLPLTLQLLAAAAAAPTPPPHPPEWSAGVAEGSILLAPTMPDFRDQLAVLYYSAPVGNGLVATVVDSDRVFLGGVYNAFLETQGRWHPSFDGWRVNGTSRATIPATTTAIAPQNATASVFALDVRRGVLLARYALGPSRCLHLERRVFSPRLGAPLLVTELEVLANRCAASTPVELRNNFYQRTTRPDGSNASIGSGNDDFSFEPLRSGKAGVGAFGGQTRGATPICFGTCTSLSHESCGNADYDRHGNRGGPAHVPTSADEECTPGDPTSRPSIAVVFDEMPAVWTVAAGDTPTKSFVSAYGSSLNASATPLAQAVAIHAHAHALNEHKTGGLFKNHVAAMAAVWSAERGGAAILVEGNDMLARGTWSALHSLVASMAPQWGRELPPQHGFGCAGLWAG